MYSDEYIEHYGDRFCELRLARHGVEFHHYLREPATYEAVGLEPEPLLPAQQAVAEEVEAQTPAAERAVDHLPRRNGAPVEPLHHRRHPRRRGAANFARRVKV